MVMPLVAKFFIPFYRRLHVTSAYEYLGKRFNYGSRVMASALYVLLQIGRMGIVVLLPSIALTLVTGIDINICIIMIGAISIFFTVKGGIEAVIWVEVTTHDLVLDGQRCRMTIANDITSRREAQARLQLLERAVQSSTSGVIIVDARAPDLPIIFVNAAFERLTGYAQEEVAGRKPR
jgi:PAS domain-containing protein